MRELKFRVWDKKYKKFFEVNLIWGLQSDVTNNNRIKDFEFQQHTGLKDRNGKDVYEGDILRAGNRHAYKVVWHEGQHRCGWNINTALKDELIGNIYETPELLK